MFSHNLLAFTSRIEFVTSDEFNKRTQNMGKDKEVQYPWTIDTIVTASKAYTEDAAGCSAGGFHNKENICMFHLDPKTALNDIDKVKSTLTDEAISLKAYVQELNGLITGGRASSKESRDVYEVLKLLISNFTSNLSILWGQNVAGIDVAYSAEEDKINKVPADTWSICSMKGIFSVEDLVRAYEITEISDNDQLFINGDEVTQGDIDKARMELNQEQAGVANVSD